MCTTSHDIPHDVLMSQCAVNHDTILCWPAVSEVGPTLNWHWFNASCLLGQSVTRCTCLSENTISCWLGVRPTSTMLALHPAMIGWASRSRDCWMSACAKHSEKTGLSVYEPDLTRQCPSHLTVFFSQPATLINTVTANQDYEPF